LLLLFGANGAAAQLCVGNTTFALSGIQSGANIDLDKLAQRYALELRVSYRDLLAAVEYGVKTWEVTSLNGTSRAFGVTLGLHSPHRRHTKFELCPLLHFRSLWGPNEIGGTFWRYSEISFSGELSAGYLLVRKKLWDIMPTAALSVGTGDPRLTTSLSVFVMRLPLPVLNRLRLLYHHGGIAEEEFVWRNSRLMSTKRDGRLLLHFSRPLVRQFELRPFSEIELSTAGEDTRNRLLSTAGRLLSRLL